MTVDSVGVVIAGVSTRAFAESAQRAGVACATVDAFGDLDQQTTVANVGLRRDLQRRYTAAAAAAVSRRFAAEAAAYVGNFENHPTAVRRLAEGRSLLGNPPDVLHRVRDFAALADVVVGAGGAVPVTLSPTAAGNGEGGVRARMRASPIVGGRADGGHSWMGQRGGPRVHDAATHGAMTWPDATKSSTTGPDAVESSVPADVTEWLRKPARGGGGSGVRRWRPGGTIGRRELVQERVDGVLASAVFVADGRRACVLGLSHQLSGDRAFGAPGYRYSGSIFPLHLPAPGDRAVSARVAAIVAAVVRVFGLRGVNGIDFIVRGEAVYVLEVNPRYPASAELIERATGASMYRAHADACAGALADVPVAGGRGVWGKAIVYARSSVVVGDTFSWLVRDDVRDVPHPGDRIGRGAPVCTVFARGADVRECRARLAVAADSVYREIEEADAARPAR